MRRKQESQLYIPMVEPASLKEVEKYRGKYRGIARLLAQNPRILELAHRDLKTLSTSSGKGRAAAYNSENLFRALVVHQIECTSFRETTVRIAESPFLQEFIRLGNRSPMDYTFLNRAFKALRPETWKAINILLGVYAVEKHKISPADIRTDTTVIAANIHYPSDVNLLWDSYRVLARLLRAAQEECLAIRHHRFHDKKAKGLQMFILRYAQSPNRQRRRRVKQAFKVFISDVRRLYAIAEKFLRFARGSASLTAQSIADELASYLPNIQTVVNTAERAAVLGETVPASERIFSIFEPHVELLMRGKRSAPCEFGHLAWLAQTREKFITDYDVMEEQSPDEDLLKPIVARHKDLFGAYPRTVAADTRFRGAPEKMEPVEAHVKMLAIPRRLKDWTENKLLPYWQRFRAGIEGSISVLKRAFRLAVCQYRGFKSFAASIGMAVVCHNLLMLAGEQSG